MAEMRRYARIHSACDASYEESDAHEAKEHQASHQDKVLEHQPTLRINGCAVHHGSNEAKITDHWPRRSQQTNDSERADHPSGCEKARDEGHDTKYASKTKVKCAITIGIVHPNHLLVVEA